MDSESEDSPARRCDFGNTACGLRSGSRTTALNRRIEAEVVHQNEIESAEPQTVDQRVLQAVAQVDRHARIELAEFRQKLRHIKRTEGDIEAELDPSRQGVVLLERVLFELARMFQQFERVTVESRADRRQRNAAGMMADQELDAEALLQRLDRGRDRRLRNVDLARRLRDAAGFDGRHEVAQLPEIV
jgi:hypothetical protein